MGRYRRKIIAVDDIQFSLLSIQQRLKSDYEVYTAQSAEVLFEILEKLTPELILLDINMPTCDGYETLEKLKSDEEFENIPVVFLTSNADRKSLVRAMELGAADFITKPYDDTDLIECIENQLDPVKIFANRPTVLAVDDNPSILATINHMLHKDYRVYTLPEPGKINEILKLIKPDLFLLDCQMPELNGYELVPMIREKRQHRDTPIIFVTSDGTVDNVFVAQSHNASDFIVKPVDEDILCEKVAQHLSGFIMKRRIGELG